MNKQLPMAREEYVRADICTPCGGRCCKRMPGSALPGDFGTNEHTIRASLRARLASGEWSVDWWEGDPREGRYDADRAYFLRPATRAGRGSVFDPTHGGTCVFFTQEIGCRIFDERPSGCRGLEPTAGGNKCEIRYASKQDAAVAWLPYTDAILSVTDEMDEVPGSDPSPYAAIYAMFDGAE